MNSGVIYRITNPSFNVYIGQTWNKGIHMSDEQKKKISISRKGKCMGNKHTLGVSPWNKGKILKKKII